MRKTIDCVDAAVGLLGWALTTGLLAVFLAPLVVPGLKAAAPLPPSLEAGLGSLVAFSLTAAFLIARQTRRLAEDLLYTLRLERGQSAAALADAISAGKELKSLLLRLEAEKAKFGGPAGE